MPYLVCASITLELQLVGRGLIENIYAICAPIHLGLVHNMMQGPCVLHSVKLAEHKIIADFGDQIQEHNAEECKDRVLVSPCIATSINAKATQCNTSGPYSQLCPRLMSPKQNCATSLMYWLSKEQELCLGYFVMYV